jgi:hypothetical protein
METTQYIQELIDHLELIKGDLRWQLSFEEVDWDHFSEFVESAKVIRNKIEELKLLEVNQESKDKSDYDPDKVGSQMKIAAEQALARLTSGRKE